MQRIFAIDVEFKLKCQLRVERRYVSETKYGSKTNWNPQPIKCKRRRWRKESKIISEILLRHRD